MRTIVKLLLISTLALNSVMGHTDPFKPLKQGKILRSVNCFGGFFSEYQSWLNFIEQKNLKKLKDKNKVDKVMARFKQSHTIDDFQRYRVNLECSNFIYSVDGHPVKGFLISPKHHPTNSHAKLPVIIFNRGGNGNFGAVKFSTMFNKLFPLADKGYIIIGSQYRGTFMQKSKVQDQFGGDDVNDVLALFDIIPTIEHADPNRIGMFGASRGVMQSYLALKGTKQASQVKALATIAGVSDLLARLESRPQMEMVYRKRIPNYETNKVAELNKRSVIQWLDQLPAELPILIMHGDQDKRVNIVESERLVSALEVAQHPYKFVRYAGDNHYLVKNKSQVQQELVNWFNQYL